VVGEVAALVETVSITLVADPPDGTTTVTEFVSAASGGRVCELSGFFDCCSKAARGAAWTLVLLAQPETKLTPRTTQKPSEIVAFMKCSIGVKPKQTACRRAWKGQIPNPKPLTPRIIVLFRGKPDCTRTFQPWIGLRHSAFGFPR
jgi:hypothetical protein